MTQPDSKQDAPTYSTRPTTQIDLEAREAAGFATVVRPTVNPNEVNAPYTVEGNDTSEYVGVDSDYMNYASDTHKPLKGEGEDAVEDRVRDDMYSGLAYSEAPTTEGVQTVGTGSSDPHVLVSTSGEKVANHEIVDRKKVTDAADEASRQVLGLPGPSDASPVRRSEDVDGAVETVSTGEAVKSAADAETPKAPQQGAPNSGDRAPGSGSTSGPSGPAAPGAPAAPSAS